MGREKQQHVEPGRPDGHLRAVHRGHGQSAVRGQRKSSATSPATYTPLIILIVIIPDAANLIPDNALAWTAYLSLTQLSLAALAIMGALVPKTYAWRVSLIAASIWWVVQALDEWLAGNFFSDSGAEYVVFLLYVIGVTAHLRVHEKRTA